MLIFSERPEVKAVSAHVQVKAGEVAELGCEVTRGSPRPEIVWSRQVRRAIILLPSIIKQIQQDQRNLTKSLMAPCTLPLSLDNLIMMKSHFLPVCQHANFNPINQLLTLNVNKRRHDYNDK